MASKAEWAWLAGIYEGEGCLTFVGKNSATLHIGMTDRDIIDRAREVAGSVGFTYVEPRGDKKTLYAWRVQKVEDLVPLLTRLRPWLGQRRGEKVDAALERLALVRRHGYCKRNHRLAGENLYVSPGGQEHCRACQKIRDRARRASP